MRGRAAKIVATIAIALGSLVVLTSVMFWAGNFYAMDETFQCIQKDSPAGAVLDVSGGLRGSDRTIVPLGISCTWELTTGEFVTRSFPLWPLSIYQYIGIALLGAGIVVRSLGPPRIPAY